MSDPKSAKPASSPVPALDAALSGSAAGPVRRALQLATLEQQLRPLLPAPLADHCRLANVAAGRLVFLVDSPVWKAKLRLAAPELVQLARSIGLPVTEVTARIHLRPNAPNTATETKPRPMSVASREALQAALDSLEAATPRASPGSNRHPKR